MQSSRGPSNRSGPGRSGSARPGRPRPSGRSATRPRSGDRISGSGADKPAGSTRTDSTSGPSRPAPLREPTISREPTAAPGDRRRASLTTRAIALAVVLLILTISYASSLRVYFNQRQDIAATRQQIITSQQNIERLSDEISRWNNPDFIRTQARVRLGWVMPGETGYRVIDADGKPVTGETEIAPDATEPPPQKGWYQKLWGSVRTADKPAVAKKKNTEPPITEKSQPR